MASYGLNIDQIINIEVKYMSEIEEKIINTVKEKFRLMSVNSDELCEFIKDYFNPNFEENQRSDYKTVMDAQEYLTPDTLMDFCKLDKFGLSKGDLETVLNVSKSTVNKLVKEKKIHLLAKISLDRKKEVHIYSVPDVIKVYEQETLPVKKSVYSDIPLEPTDENIAQALYVINKSAKVSRDTKQKKYNNNKYALCKSAKTRMQNHYNLKEAVMRKLIDENRMKYIGICKQNNKHSENYLDMYKMCGFVFHLPSDKSKYTEENNILSDINGVISSEKTIKVNIKYHDAIRLLEEYSGHNYKKCDLKINHGYDPLEDEYYYYYC